MIKIKQTILQQKFLATVLIIVILVVSFVYFGKFNLFRRQQPESSSYQMYQNSEYGFSIEYPSAWEVKYDTHLFENGDIIAFKKTGPTQKP